MKELFGWHRLPKRKLKAHYFQNGYPLCGNIYVKEVATYAPDAFMAYTGPPNGKCLSCRYDYAVTHDALREIRGPIIKIDESNDTTTMPDIHLPHGKFTIRGFVEALNSISGQEGEWSFDHKKRLFVFTPNFRIIWSSEDERKAQRESQSKKR